MLRAGRKQSGYLTVISVASGVLMLNCLQKSSDRARLTQTLLAGVLLGFASGCAGRTTASDSQPAAAPQDEPATVSAGTSKEIPKRLHEHVQTLLTGRTAGVEVALNPDGSISVRIRGATSFYAGSEPLYILDGTPMQPGPRGALTGINPYDIESIEVLKGPPETTLYGVRGANGVIIIKTKLRK